MVDDMIYPVSYHYRIFPSRDIKYHIHNYFWLMTTTIEIGTTTIVNEIGAVHQRKTSQ